MHAHNVGGIRSTGGFSLIELIIVLAIIAIFAHIAFYNGFDFYQKNQLQKRATEIKLAIQWGRIQALLRQEVLCLDAKDWSLGMTLCLDTPKHRCTEEKNILYQWQWPRHEIHVQWQGFQSQHSLFFSPHISANTLNGFFLLHDRSHHEIKLVINRLGRVYSL